MIGQPRATDSRGRRSWTWRRSAGGVAVCGLLLVLLLAAGAAVVSVPVEASVAETTAAKRVAALRWQAKVRCPSFERRGRVSRVVTRRFERYHATCRSSDRELHQNVSFNRRTCTITYGIELTSDDPITDPTETTLRLQRRVGGRWVAVETTGSAGGVSGISPDRRRISASTTREVENCRGLRELGRRSPVRVRGHVLAESIWGTILDSARRRKKPAARAAADDGRRSPMPSTTARTWPESSARATTGSARSASTRTPSSSVARRATPAGSRSGQRCSPAWST